MIVELPEYKVIESYVSAGVLALFSNMNAIARTFGQSTLSLLRAFFCIMSRASERYCWASESDVGEGARVGGGTCVGVGTGVTGPQAVRNNTNNIIARIICGDFFDVCLLHHEIISYGLIIQIFKDNSK